MTGFGAFPGRMMMMAGEPIAEPITIAHWSGNETTVDTIPNRIVGSAIGPLIATEYGFTFPSVITLINGVKALHFNADCACRILDSEILRYESPAYWAFHMRGANSYNNSYNGQGVILCHFVLLPPVRVRMQVMRIAAIGGAYPHPAGLAINIGTPGTNSTFGFYPIDDAAMLAGIFLEIIFDGAEDPVTLDRATPGPIAVSVPRLKVYVNSIEIPCWYGGSDGADGGGTIGTIPDVLLTGVDNDQGQMFIATGNSFAGAYDMAHIYLSSTIPSPETRLEYATFEAPQWA